MGYQKVVYELGIKIVIDVVHSVAYDDVFEFGFIIQSCIHVLDQEQNYVICYVRRQANALAYALARASHSFASPTIWYQPPSFIGVIL